MTVADPSMPITVPDPSSEPRSDVDRALAMFAALGLGGCSDEMYMATIPGAPWSKARPRFGRGGRTYSNPGDVDAEKRTAAYLRRVCRQPMTGNVALGAVFFRPNRQRIDADNLLKHVCDAATGVVWHDDSQCTAIMGVVELDAANPRTVVVIGEHQSTMVRGTDAVYPCRICGKPVAIGSQGVARRKTCSAECSTRAKGYTPLNVLVPCGQCGKPFRRFTKTQQMCSAECGAAARRDRPKRMRVPFSTCEGCGAELTHRRGGRCRDCWRADQAANKAARQQSLAGGS